MKLDLCAQVHHVARKSREEAERQALHREARRIIADAMVTSNRLAMSLALLDCAYEAAAEAAGELPALSRYASRHGLAMRSAAPKRADAETAFRKVAG